METWKRHVIALIALFGLFLALVVVPLSIKKS